MSDQETRFDDAVALYDKGEYKKAAPLFKALANEGYAPAQYVFGVCCANAHGVWHSDSKAVEWWEKAAAQGHAEAQASLGIYYLQSYGMSKKQKAEGFEWALKAADQGNARGQAQVGICYHTGEGVDQDYAKALEWYTKATDQGDATAQFNMGMMYHDGAGVPQDDNKAVEWWTKAADQGFANAQFNLGVLCDSNNNHSEAVKWHTKAADQGHLRAMLCLHIYYQGDSGVPRDDAKSFDYCLKVAQTGYAPAQYNLAQMYHEGRGTKRDYKQAVAWWEKAAEQGHILAINNMVCAYRDGKGVGKSEDSAAEWYQKGVDQQAADRRDGYANGEREFPFPESAVPYDDSGLSGKGKTFAAIMAVIGCIAGFIISPSGFWWTLLGIFIGGIAGYMLVTIISNIIDMAPKKTSASSSSSSRSSGSSSSGGKPVPLVVQILFAVVCGIGIFVAALWVYAQISQETSLSGIFTLVTLGVGGGLSFFAMRSKNIPLIAVMAALAVFGYLALFKVIPEPNRPSAATEAAIPAAVTGTTTSDVNLRAEPSGSAALVKVLKKGEKVTITGDVSGSWIPIEHNGDKGWVSSEYVKK